MNSMYNNLKTTRQTVRRGNAMVMVVGLLVLLVIIATSYIVRTNSGRLTASSQRIAVLRDDKSKVISEMLADVLSQQLFAKRYEQQGGIGLAGPVGSNVALISSSPFALRYEVDPTDFLNNSTGAVGFDGIPDNPYNFPPYHVVAWTNWPDPLFPADYLSWPAGSGNPNGATLGNLAFEGNPVGNPGFGDNRPLADNEPLRWDTSGNGILDSYSHWRHMSNIATANNGFRIVFGINDIGDQVFDIDDGSNDGIDYRIGTIITDLSIPVEQWLTVKPDPSVLDAGGIFSTVSGNAIFSWGSFYQRWSDWFFVYKNIYSDTTRIPQNFYDLSDLDGDGRRNFWVDGNGVPQESPQSEFIAGTARHAVSSILADTDGDGFTDAFWMLAPTMTESGIRQIVAVRIIDNSAMLNVNVGTQFVHADPAVGFPQPYKTRSVTPADLLLVGDIYNVGYFDNPQHHEAGFLYGDPFNENEGALDIGLHPSAWSGSDSSFLAELGVLNNDNFPLQFTTAFERLRYWQAAGSSPFDPRLAVTPFSLTEELELRAYHGQNIPWIASRLEKAIQPNTAFGSVNQFLHANVAREETSELQDQLYVRELLFDHRKRLTTYSGARNDLMPPWLWWRLDLPLDVQEDAAANPEDKDSNGIADVIDRFYAQSRKKLDLRENLNPPSYPLQLGEHDLAARLPGTLFLALTDGDELRGNSYYGKYSSTTDPKYVNSQRAAAAFAANILEWSDDDSGYVDLETAAIPLPGAASGNLENTRFLGIEKQPFLVEALIAHVHEVTTSAIAAHPGDIVIGDNIMCQGAPGSTIVAVQIANPFDDVLNLAQFQLSVFGQAYQLPAGTLNPGASLTYYAMEDTLETVDLDGAWRILMNFDNIVTVDITNSGIWSTDRSFYDSLSTVEIKKAVEIYRTIGTTNVLVDRIDIASPTSEEDFDFGESIGEKMRDKFPTGSCNEPGVGEPWNFVINVKTSDYWIQWSHVTRAWQRDINSDSLISPDERNPRYVFSYRRVQFLADNTSGNANIALDEDPTKFEFKDKGDVPDASSLTFTMQMLQRDDDFEQVGELLNVFMFGHELEFDAAGDYTRTTQTFSEFMIDNSLVGNKERVNRLHVVPYQITGTIGPNSLGHVLGIGNPVNYRDPLHGIPAIPAGARVLDMFVCDGPGINGSAGVDDYLGANGFSGKLTPGLINVNSAAQEVMRAIPHFARLVHEVGTPNLNPFVRVAEAMVRYRERFGDPVDLNDKLPAYGDRGNDDFLNNDDLDDLRGDRGIVSLGELLLLEQPATNLPEKPLEPNNNYRISFAGHNPYKAVDIVESTQISIDLNDIIEAGINQPDIVSMDVEEQNLLFAGMSNLLTTRSDVFTVYFRIRSFRQNPVGPDGGPVWDATNLEFIVDDSRYVMLVDRSEVNKPSDKPKILYLEKLAK